MSPALAYTQNMQEVALWMGALQWFGLWLVACFLSIVLVRVISWWFDR